LKKNAAAEHSFLKSSFATLADFAAEVSLDAYEGWSIEIASPLYNQLGLDALDQVTDVGALSAAGELPARIKKDAYDVEGFFELSGLSDILNQKQVGLPNSRSEMPLTGGAKGATTSADIIAGLEKFQKFHVNFVLPLFSRDATDDISDSLTDSGSTYTIDGIHQAVKTHISLMKTTKKRSERQAVLSYKASYEACKEKAGVLADGRIQLVFQDIRQIDGLGNIKWFQPWAFAALMTGARSGSSVGTPMTFKFLNASGIRHTAQPMTTAEQDIVTDFDPDLQYDDAIQAGLTFMEAPQTGGFRVVVDNTTYGRDANFVWNRGSVIYAADIVLYNLRNAMEARFIGVKNTVSVADISGFAASVLNNFLAQGITVSTPKAPQGFHSLVVRLKGNVIELDVTIILVEGIEYILNNLTVERAVA
jgi:hypothetical protein